MPTYAYLCGACEAAVEFFQSMKEGPKRKCPNCGQLKLQRQIGGGAGFIFKGSGFYETDYRSESYKAGEAAEKRGGSGTADKGTDSTGSSSEGGVSKGGAESSGSTSSNDAGDAA